MLNEIESAREFYPFTASRLPTEAGSIILDLGCGTGLELEEYFKLCPEAKVTGIDLSSKMLDALRAKFLDRDLNLVCGSYFDIDLGYKVYDAAVSVESLHHFTRGEKIVFYANLCDAIKDGGYFILTDYFAASDEEEKKHRSELAKMKREQGIKDNEIYHYDTPLTVKHEIEALLEGGFEKVEILNNWGATYTLKALKL